MAFLKETEPDILCTLHATASFRTVMRPGVTAGASPGNPPRPPPDRAAAVAGEGDECT